MDLKAGDEPSNDMDDVNKAVTTATATAKIIRFGTGAFPHWS